MGFKKRQCTIAGPTENSYCVIATCRSASRDLEALNVRVIEGIDVSSEDGVTRLASELDGEPVDVLINNAGILRRDNFEDIDYEGMVEQFRVNSLGPLRVTRALSNCLQKGSKVGIVSSRVGSIEDNGSGGNYGYRASKTAVNMIGTNLKHDLAPLGIAVALLHPGLVATEMTAGTGISPADAARGILQRMDELSMETTGGFWHAEGYELPW